MTASDWAILRPPISTVCVGQAASGGAVLLAGGQPGMRYTLPNSRVLIHQPHGGAQGQSADLEIQAREILRLRQVSNEIMARHTGQSVEKIAADTDRDFIMTPRQAQEYGMIDEIITTRHQALSAPSSNGHVPAG
jgi:ATP-dependent Clp protease, protease subunit